MVLTERQRVAAYGLVGADDTLLLVRASAADGTPPHTWWLPGGGVLFGERPQECLAREFAEETGLRISSARLRDAVSDVGPIVSESVLLHSIRLIYDVTVVPGHTVSESDGSTDQVAWVPESDLTGLPLVPWLRSYLADNLAQ